MASCPKRTVSVHDIYKAVKDSAVERKELLKCMGLDPSKISEYETNSKENPERAFIDSLGLVKLKEGKEWDEIIDSLKSCGDVKTTENIYKMQSVKLDDDRPIPEAASTEKKEDTYCEFFIGSPQYRIEHYEKMKTTATTRYNRAKRKIDECHNDIQTALDAEHEEAITQINSYKEQMEMTSDRLEKDNQALIEKAKATQEKIQEAIARLKRGDHSGIALLKTYETELDELKEQKKKSDNELKNFKKNTHKPYKETSAVDLVEDLKRVLTISRIDGDIDEDDYITFDDVND